jgi:hypothetical protein
MRFFQQHPMARLFTALVVSVPVALIAWSNERVALAAFFFVVLTVVAFALLTIAPDAIALRRGHYWRWWWRSSGDEGPFWPGTHIPRGPRRPSG